MAKYLDKSGVTYLWNKIKGLFTDQSLNTKNKTYAGAINEINTKVGNLTGAFLWKGKFDTLPAVTDYEAGNVVGVGKKEYVLTVTEGTKTWEEFGDEGSYLLKTAAEETYLKKAAGEVKTANLADNAVISTKLDKGARKPIILTDDTTEVDEETYQKLLSDDVDVVFKVGGSPLYLHCKESSGNDISLWFGYIATRPISAEFPYGYSVIVQIIVTISSATPHKLVLSEPSEVAYKPDEFIEKSTLTPVLQEIDLTGTDADRKAKLDQFETDWKALTGASDLTGARFVGYYSGSSNSRDTLDLIISTLLVWDDNEGSYHGFGVDDSGIKRLVYLETTGIITCANIMEGAFSHLEAITIYTDNTPEHMQANLDNIAAYEANLQALGVDISSKSHIIPFGQDDFERDGYGRGYLVIDDNAVDVYLGQFQITDGTIYSITINGQGKVDNVRSILDDYYQSLNAKSLEAITIRTGNTTDDKAANIAAIKAYVDNLIALGVDVTKGYMIPICFSNTELGYVMYHPFSTGSEYTGIITGPGGASSNIAIEKDGYAYVTTHIQPVESSLLTTTAETIVPAINEVNALAKSKQDKLTSGTNIKTVNGQSLLGSGDITISGGGGSAPVLVDIDDISGSAGDSVPVDVFNKIANAASAKTPIFGYSKLVDGQKTTYEIIPLYVKHVSITDINGFLSIQFIAESAYNSIGIVKRSDTECSILTNPPRPFALDTSVDKSSTRGIQSSAVWNEIHSEPMTVNTATSGVTTLSSTDKHKILCYADSGTQQYNLPPSPVDGETFLFLKVKSGHAITIQSGTDNQNIYDCSSGNSVVSKTIASSTKSKITVTYSSTVDKWFLMADDFLS